MPESEDEVKLKRPGTGFSRRPQSPATVGALALILPLLLPNLVLAAVPVTTGTVPRRVKMVPTSPTVALQAVPTSVTAATPPAPVFMTMAQLDAKIRPPDAPRQTTDVMVLLYNGNRRAYIEPCACRSHRLGGIDREARVTSRVQEWGLPMVKVDAGGFGRKGWNIRDYLMSRYMMGAMKMMNYDAINVGLVDLELGPAYFADVKKNWAPPFLSANIMDVTSAPLFMPYKVMPVQLGSGETVRVGIIGVTRPGPVVERKWRLGGATITTGSGIRVREPAEALKEYLPELRKKSDTIILLIWQTREKTQEFLSSLGPDCGIDIAVASEMTVGKPITYYRNNMQGVGGTRIVGTWMEGRYLGNLMLSFTDGKPTGYANRLVEIEQGIQPLPEVTELVQKYRADLRNPKVLNPQ